MKKIKVECGAAIKRTGMTFPCGTKDIKKRISFYRKALKICDLCIFIPIFISVICFVALIIYNIFIK